MIPVSIVNTFLELIGNKSIFHVVFIKKNGETRNMTCRRGVKKHLRGGESTIKNNSDLVGVYEMGNHYRCFNKNQVLELRGAGIVIKTRDSG